MSTSLIPGNDEPRPVIQRRRRTAAAPIGRIARPGERISAMMLVRVKMTAEGWLCGWPELMLSAAARGRSREGAEVASTCDVVGDAYGVGHIGSSTMLAGRDDLQQVVGSIRVDLCRLLGGLAEFIAPPRRPGPARERVVRRVIAPADGGLTRESLSLASGVPRQK